MIFTVFSQKSHLLAGLILPLALYPGTGYSDPVPRVAQSIAANDNRKAAGREVDGVRLIDLEVVAGTFTPEAEDGPSIPALAFAESGERAQIPGPLIRITRGTVVHVRIHNPFADSTLTVFGLRTPSPATDSGIRIPPGTTREVRFVASRPGNYFYWGTTGNRSMKDRLWFETQLSGALIVDEEPGVHNDRVFVIGVWDRPGDSTLATPRALQVVMTINGKTWPNTERFVFTQGERVNWRWINSTGASHPMHLHGFYFNVERRGDGAADRKFSGDARPRAVTELILPGHTAAISWVPERPGNWLFHCHFAFHVSSALKLNTAAPEITGKDSHAESTSHAPVHAVHQMAGLVLGITVNPAVGSVRPKKTTGSPRDIRLIAQSAPKRFGSLAGMGYVIQSGGQQPAADSIQIPGPLLLLQKDQPVRITVVNHLPFETAVHWHGIELESFPDGVPNWSGSGARIMPPIAPRDSFVAEFTPPRAGTFIYHTHSNEMLQMGSGLYGPLIVFSPDHPYDPEVDKLILVGGAGPADSLPQFDFESPGLVNGSNSPPPMNLRVGRTYRFRFININPDWRVVFSLLSESAIMSWRPIAKDGADIPYSQRRLMPANWLTGPGETGDFEFTPRERGKIRLEIKTQLSGWIIPITINVQ